MASNTVVNIGLGYSLLPEGTKPLSEPTLTKHQRGLVAFTWVQFQVGNAQDLHPWKWVWKKKKKKILVIQDYSHISMRPMSCKSTKSILGQTTTYQYWPSHINFDSRTRRQINLSGVVLELEYSVIITRSTPWLLMPWLLVTSPGHQQLWYWVCRINKSASSKKNDISYLHNFIYEK